MAKLFAIAVIIAGCSHSSPPEPKTCCLKWESYTYTTMIMVNKVAIPQLHIGYRCIEQVQEVSP